MLLCLYGWGISGFFPDNPSYTKAGEGRPIPVKIPVLFLSGTMDPVGERTKGVRRVFRWYDKAGAKDLTLGFYKGARHEVLNEINRGEVYEDALEWLKNHM